MMRLERPAMAKILIVDDDVQILRLLTLLLRREGHDVSTAEDPRDAFAMWSQPVSFDLILSDVDMPGMDGHELARWVAARSPESRVMLMSALDPDCQDCPYSPRCEFIRKPFHPKELVKQVAAALRPPAA